MNEELLISLVSQYKELYDTGDSRYHDEQRRNNIWQEIADIMKSTAKQCRDRWKRLRDNFRRAKKLRQTKSGQAASKNKPIKYEKEMEFLNCYLETESQALTNLPQRESDEEETVCDNISPPSTPLSPASSKSSTSNVKKRHLEATSESSTSTKALFQSYLEKKYGAHSNNNSNNTVVDFFTNLGQTVKNLPEDLQIRVKGAVFKIVNDAEAEMLQRKYSYPGQQQNSQTHFQYPYTHTIPQTHTAQFPEPAPPAAHSIHQKTGEYESPSDLAELLVLPQYRRE